MIVDCPDLKNSKWFNAGRPSLQITNQCYTIIGKFYLISYYQKKEKKKRKYIYIYIYIYTLIYIYIYIYMYIHIHTRSLANKDKDSGAYR